MELKPIGHYARALKPELPEEFFCPVPRRALWLLLHLGLYLGLGAWVVLARPHWALAALAAVVMGHSLGCLGFVGHEILHGSVVKTPWLRQALGQICFAPYLLVVEFWNGWHNRTHHAHTQSPAHDPDIMPTVEDYFRDKTLRLTSRFMVGWNNPLTFLVLSFGFMSHQSMVLFFKSVDYDILTPAARRRCIVKYILLLAFWLSWIPVLGFAHFALLVLLPMGLANILIMLYIMTNHNLNPRTEINDPLVNSLTVRTPRWLGVLHLDFGYHVEHHIYPTMSGAYTARVHEKAKAKWPTLYQELPLAKALWLLMVTPRYYENDAVLLDPKKGQRWVTLGAENLGANTAYLAQLTGAREMAREALEMKPWTVATSKEAAWALLEQQSEKLGLAREQALKAAREKWELQSMKLSLARETARTMVALQKEKVRQQQQKYRETTVALKAQWREAQAAARQNTTEKLQEKQQQLLAAQESARERLRWQKETLASVRATARAMVREQKAQFLAARRLALAGA